MASHAVASRSVASRCVVCSSRTDGGWFCEGHGFNSTFVSARVSEDYIRPYRPRSRTRYLAMSEDRTTEREHYGLILRSIGNGRHVVMRSQPGAAPITTDQRRWCDECICYMRHRAGCPMIFHDGMFIGGYESEPTREPSTKFGDLRTPDRSWTRHHHKQHRRALDRRWRAFAEQWTKIALHVLADRWTVGKVMKPRLEVVR